MANTAVMYFDMNGLACCGHFALTEIVGLPVSVEQQANSGGNTKLNGFKALFIPCDSCSCPEGNIKLVQAKQWTGVGLFGLGGSDRPAFDNGKATRNIVRQLVYPSYLNPGETTTPEKNLAFTDGPYNSIQVGARFDAEVCAFCSKASGDKLIGCASFSFDGATRKLIQPKGSMPITTKDLSTFGQTAYGTAGTAGYILPCVNQFGPFFTAIVKSIP